MQFDSENIVNKLCAQGMDAEGAGNPGEAACLFHQAWNEAVTVQEKFTAAHYVARHQDSTAGKLEWDMTALKLALEISGPEIRAVYPSLYLNVAKGFEDLHEPVKALENYRHAQEHISRLPADGYGEMIRAGIKTGIDRVSKHE